MESSIAGGRNNNLIWLQITRTIEVHKGDILIFRLDTIQQLQPKVFRWIVTPLNNNSLAITLNKGREKKDA